MATLIVDGQEYDFDFDFNVGEARTLFRLSGVTLDKLQENKSNPHVTAAIVLIAFQRKWPDTPTADLEKRVDKVKLATLDLRDDEVVLPPESTRSGQNGSASTSGETSKSGAETSPASATPAPTGHPI